MATNYTTKTAALKATTADIRKLTAKTLSVDDASGTSTNILDLISNVDGSAVKSIGVTDSADHVTLTSATIDKNGNVQLTLTESDIASAATLKTVSDDLDVAEGKITTLTGTGEGSVAKALADAKAYTDELATGQVTTNKNNIATLTEKVGALESGKLTYQVVHSLNTDNKTYKETSNATDKECVVNVIYLVPNTTIGAYVEYLCCMKDNAKHLERIGTTAADLSGYATKATSYSKDSGSSNLVKATVTSGVTDAVTEVAINDSALDTKLAAMVSATSDAQSDVNNLETLVGTIPTGSSATTVVGYAKEVADAAKAATALTAGSGISISTANKISVSPTHTYSSSGETPVSGKAIAAAIGTLDSGNESNGVTYTQVDGIGSVTVVTATTGQYGTTQLSNSITSDDDTLAATPKAVKLAIADAASTAQTKANTALAAAKDYADDINTTLTAAVTKATLTGTTDNGLTVSVTDGGTTVSMAAANTNTVGTVKLSDSTTGTETAATGKTAATPKAVSDAIAAAATTAQTKANTAKSEAIAAAATDATTKADAAQAAAISAAATDATTKANAAQAAAEATAAADATSKANAAQAAAKTYTDGQITEVRKDLTELSGGAITTINGDTESSELVKVAAAKAQGDSTTVNLTVTVTDVAKASDLTALTQTVSTNKNTADTGIQEAKAAAAKALTDANAYTDERETAITTAYQTADTALDNRIKANEDKLANITTVTSAIATAKSEAIADAKTYTDGQITTLSGAAVKSIAGDESNSFVKVKASTKDANGKVTLEVTTSDIASADALSALDTKVTNHIADAAKLGIVVAEATGEDNHPNVTSPSTNKIYLVAADSPESGTYVEWIYVEKSDKTKVWEKIGTTATDLTEYAKAATVKSDIATAKTEAINTAAGDATTKANAAQTAAEATADAALTAATTDLEGKIATAKTGAETTAKNYTDNKIAALSTGNGAIAGIDSRVSTLETEVNTNIPADIATAKTEAINTAAGDATTKANNALADAKTYADGKITALKVTGSTNDNGLAWSQTDGKVSITLTPATSVTDGDNTVVTGDAVHAAIETAKTDAATTAQGKIDGLNKASHGAAGVTASQSKGIVTLSVTTASVNDAGAITENASNVVTATGAQKIATAAASAAVNGLDVTGATTNGITWSQTDGKVSISVSAGEVASNNTSFVTGGAVKTAITNAVNALDVGSHGGHGITASQTDGIVTLSVSPATTVSTSTDVVTAAAVKTYVDAAAAKATTKVANSDTNATSLGYCRVSSSTGSDGSTTYTVDNDPRITVTKTQLGSAVTSVEGDVITGGSVKFVDWSKVEIAEGAFQSNISLQSFHADLENLINGKNMFNGCTGLSSFCGDLSSLTDGTDMFKGCALDLESVIYIVDSLPALSSGNRNITIGVDKSLEGTADLNALITELQNKRWIVA